MIRIENWSQENSKIALEFLKERYASSMFLLGNLSNQGSTLTQSPNSGNFKVIKQDEMVLGVFCLTRRGNLLINSKIPASTSELIFQECQKEQIQIKGVIGEWESSSVYWKHLQSEKLITTCSFQSKEILFQLSTMPHSMPVPKVRFLVEKDFEEWLPIRRAYNKEEGLAHDLPEKELKANFLRFAEMKEFWGYFEANRMISVAALNARALDIGQVGGVYTLPEFRRRGFSKLVMRQMLTDCATIHGFKKMILFTGEKNIAAQKVYDSLAFERIGYFGIFFI